MLLGSVASGGVTCSTSLHATIPRMCVRSEPETSCHQSWYVSVLAGLWRAVHALPVVAAQCKSVFCGLDHLAIDHWHGMAAASAPLMPVFGQQCWHAAWCDRWPPCNTAGLFCTHICCSKHNCAEASPASHPSNVDLRASCHKTQFVHTSKAAIGSAAAVQQTFRQAALN